MTVEMGIDDGQLVKIRNLVDVNYKDMKNR